MSDIPDEVKMAYRQARDFELSELTPIGFSEVFEILAVAEKIIDSLRQIHTE